jgi:catecholate siderophore receptor
VPGYARWDATLAYQVTKNIGLRLNIQNIMDETYYDRLHPGHVEYLEDARALGAKSGAVSS